MARFTKQDIIRINQSASFLYNMGYISEQRDDSLIISNPTIEFTLVNTRHCEPSDIAIKFLKYNEPYSVGWIAFIINNKKKIDDSDPTNYLIQLLDFVRKNYNDVTDIGFCEECMQEVDKYIESNLKK